MVRSVCVYAQSLQSCLTPCDPMDYSTPGSSVRGVLQARMLDWVAAPSSKESSCPRNQTHVSASFMSPPALAGRFFITSTNWEACGT